VGFFVREYFFVGGGEGWIFFFFFEDEADSDNYLKNNKKQPKQDGLDPLVALSLPLYMVTSVSTNTVL